jgi:uncharacterized phage-associated protein
MSKPELKKEDYILYILNHLEPEKSDFWCLNKIAFLVEFGYLYFKEKPLSNAQYAAIDHGPVIDEYKETFKAMEKKGLIKTDGYKIRIVGTEPVKVSNELAEFMNPLIKKYSQMTQGELKALTHATDSYKITTSNEKFMGNIIDKNLARLETFYEEDFAKNASEQERDEVDLPRVDFNKLKKYEL